MEDDAKWAAENAAMEQQADRIAAQIDENAPNYKDDPDPDALVDENPEAPNGLFGDHQDTYDLP